MGESPPPESLVTCHWSGCRRVRWYVCGGGGREGVHITQHRYSFSTHFTSYPRTHVPIRTGWKRGQVAPPPLPADAGGHRDTRWVDAPPPAPALPSLHPRTPRGTRFWEGRFAFGVFQDSGTKNNIARIASRPYTHGTVCCALLLSSLPRVHARARPLL